MHAKCVVADSRHVFVSSANFTEAAQERNVEIGLLLIRSPPQGGSTTFSLHLQILVISNGHPE